MPWTSRPLLYLRDTQSSPPRLEAFRETIAAEVVSGYATEVDWLESAVVDLMLMSRLTRHKGRVDLAVRALRKDAGPLLDRLGFVTAPTLA